MRYAPRRCAKWTRWLGDYRAFWTDTLDAAWRATLNPTLMSANEGFLMNEPDVATLVVRRLIRATPERLFAFWTEPEHLVRWWGPNGASCPAAEIDLRAGGSYRIANRFADGTVVWIGGVFEEVQRPNRLVYTWQLERPAASRERVSVSFEKRTVR